MPPRPTAAVTGAFSYTGRYLTRRLLDAGYNVINLSGNPRPEAVASFTEEERTHRLSSVPLDFSQTCPSFSASASTAASSATSLPAALEGVDVLFCTYWIRFAVDGDSHTKAADRVAGLFDLAKRVGVGKVVFSSHTQATESSPFTYIAGKARAAAALRAAGVPYGIVRPCGIFGDTPLESILMNNAAWVLRRSPLFLLAGDGAHQFQPIHVRDMADLMFDVGTGGGVADERDACGPDVPTARELFSAIGKAVGRSIETFSVPAPLLLAGGYIDRLVRRSGAKLTPDRARYFAHPDWTVDTGKRPPRALWTPQIDTREGLAETADWYRSEGWL